MSLNDPARRPWGTARGARIISLSAWVVVAIGALLAAAWWVRNIQSDESALLPAIVAFNVSIFAGIGALFIDLGTAQRRGVEETSALPRLPGAWFTGAGIGTIAAVVLAPDLDASALPWGLLMSVAGSLVFVSPELIERHRRRQTQRHAHVRASGIRTSAKVTRVSMFFRDDHSRYRVTMRFTDQHGDRRWFTKTAPAGTRPMEEGDALALHYDPASPSHRRTLVLDWPTW